MQWKDLVLRIEWIVSFLVNFLNNMISNSNRIHSQNMEVLLFFSKYMWVECGGLTLKIRVPFTGKVLPSVLMIYSYRERSRWNYRMEINSNGYALNWAVIVQMSSMLTLMFSQLLSFKWHLHKLYVVLRCKILKI